MNTIRSRSFFQVAKPNMTSGEKQGVFCFAFAGRVKLS
jgi:hypothetical protein